MVRRLYIILYNTQFEAVQSACFILELSPTESPTNTTSIGASSNRRQEAKEEVVEGKGYVTSRETLLRKVTS